MRGLGTLLNVATVLTGSSVGVLMGGRLPQRTREVVTDGLGLVTLMVAALDGASVLDPALHRAAGSAGAILVVLGAVLIGGITGSLLRIEARLDGIGAALQLRFSRPARGERGTVPEDMAAAIAPPDMAAGAAQRDMAAAGRGTDRDRFIQGFVTASLVYCVGPLTILGSLQDGLGRGIDQLALKSTLDGFASIAFAAALGWGVAAAALSVLVVQGALTAAAAVLGGLLTDAQVASMTATGGLLLAGIAFRLLRLRAVPVADLLPALIAAPVLTGLVAALR